MWKQNGISGSNAAQPAFNAGVTLLSGGAATSGESMGPTLTLTLSAPPATSGTALSTVTANTASTSVDSGTGAINIWDGLMAQALLNASGSGVLGSIVARPSAANGTFGLADLDALLLTMYAQSGGDPDLLVVNPIDAARLTNLQFSSNQTRFVIEANSSAQSDLIANTRLTHYLNKTTGKAIPIVEHRYCPVGTLLFVPLRMPFPVAEVGNAIEVETNQEYFGVDFALTDASYKFAVFVEETLKVYYLGGLGMIWGCIPSA
jgi:hypothetical protein